MINPLKLDFEHTVPKKFVHKAAISEVLITDSLRVSNGSYLVASQWPRAHHFYPVAQGWGLLGLLAETMRQGIFLLCHRHLSVPLGTYFLMDRLVVTLMSKVPMPSQHPAEVGVHFMLDEVTYTAGQLRALTFDAKFSSEGRVFGSGRGELRLVRPAVFEKLRAGREQSSSVMSSRNENSKEVSEALSEDCWRLRVPYQHAVFFDHPLDHVPGMLVFEAVRQSLQNLYGPTAELTHFDGSFMKFLEFDPDIYIVRTTKAVTPLQSAGNGGTAEEDFLVVQGLNHSAAINVRASLVDCSDRVELSV